MINMKKIAEKAGVSRTTVSFVLSGRCHQDQRVSEAVEKKVLDTARELGYVRNDLVLSLVKGKSRAIAIVSDFRDFMFPIIRGYAQEAQNHGYSIRLFQADADLNETITKAAQARVDAIVCIGFPKNAWKKVAPRFFELGIPITGLGHNPDAGHSAFDQRGSAAKVVEHLVQCGCRKILCYGGNYIQMTLREAGYRDIMAKYDLTPVCLSAHKVSCDEIIDKKPDAVFCGDDYLACRLLQTAFRRNIRVPDDFCVAGVGNTVAGQYSSPSLTTVDEPYFKTGALGARRIIAKLENQPVPEYAPVIGELIVRESTKNNPNERIIKK